MISAKFAVTRLLRKNLSLLLLLAAVTACDDVGLEELKRSPSPDGKVEAVLIRVSGYATDGFGYRVYIVLPQERIDNFDDTDANLVAYKVDHIDIEWSGDKELTISYGEMKILHFSNFWYSKKLDDFEHEIRIDLEQV